MAKFIEDILRCLRRNSVFIIKRGTPSISAIVIIGFVFTGKGLADSDSNSPLSAKDSTNGSSTAESTGEVLYKNATYHPKGSITVTPSSNPIQGSGTIAINGTTYLVATTNPKNTAASSPVDVTLTVSINSIGDISVLGVPNAPQTNSGGRTPNILDNTLTITVTGNGSKTVTIKVTDDATGVGTLRAVRVRAVKIITLASRSGQSPAACDVSIHPIQ